MASLRFDFRDIFKANRIAFSLQRIWIQFLGVTIGYFAYLIFTYVSIIVAGEEFSAVWSQMGLLPCLAVFKAPWYSWIIFIIGLIILIAVYLITSTAVSRATYKILRGNNFYTWKEAFRFAFKKAGSVLFSPLAITTLIILFIIGGMVIALLGKIPYVGELGFSLTYFLWLLAGLLLVFFIIVLSTSLILSPAIIATTDEDAFEAVFQSFSTFWSQPWRLILYEALSIVLSVVGVLVLAFLVKKAFLLTDAIFTFVMGDKYINLMGQGMYILSNWISTSIGWMNSLFGEKTALFYLNNIFMQLDLPVVLTISSYIFVLMMLFIGGWIIAYGLATYNVGNTILYLIMRKKKDDENLLEREDREEQEEEEQERKQEEQIQNQEKLEQAQDTKKIEEKKKTRRTRSKKE